MYTILRKNNIFVLWKKGLLTLAQLILPSEIILNFKVVKVDEQSDFIRIHLDEIIKESYKSNHNIESKGFCDSVIIRDFPIRDKGVDLIVRRRRGSVDM